MTDTISLINLNKDKQGVYGWLRLADFKESGPHDVIFKVGNKKIPAEIRIPSGERGTPAVEIAEKTLHFRRNALIDRRLVEKWDEIHNAVVTATPYAAEMIILG